MIKTFLLMVAAVVVILAIVVYLAWRQACSIYGQENDDLFD